MINLDIETLKNIVLQLGEKVSIPEEELLKVVERNKEELRRRGVAEEKIEHLAWAKTRNALKRKLVIPNNIEVCNGFLLGRTKWFDRSRRAREEAENFVQEHGIEAAILEGYVNENGVPIYRSPKWREGQEIPEEDPGAVGIGLFERNGAWKLAEIDFKGNAAKEYQYPFKMGLFPIYVKEETDTTMRITISRNTIKYSDYVDLEEYLDVIKERAGDRILTDFNFDEFINTHINEFNAWCIIEAEILNITPTKKGGTMISVEKASDPFNFDEITTIGIYFPEDYEIDFSEDAVEGVFVVSPYYNNEGEIGLSGLGYWVEDIYRVEESEEAPVDYKNPWG